MPVDCMQFRWREPEETGGLPIDRYRLQISPPPAGAEASADAEVRNAFAPSTPCLTTVTLQRCLPGQTEEREACLLMAVALRIN